MNKISKNVNTRVQKYRRIQRQKAMYEEQVVQRIRTYDEMRGNKVSSEEIAVNSNLSAEEFDLRDNLKAWAGKHHITHMAIKDLLQILRAAGFNSMCKDSRTLMHTPVCVNIRPLSDGKLWYRGLYNCLEDVFFEINHEISITLDFNFDGLPLFSSSKLQFWPILSSIQGAYAMHYLPPNLRIIHSLFLFNYIQNFQKSNQ